MELRELGHSGLRLSLVGVGCNNFGGRIDYEAAKKVIDAALDAGINHFDTADIYGGGGPSEEFLGRALGDRRKEIVVATKFGKPMPGNTEDHRGAPHYVKAAVEASLKRLGTDWIDLLFMHEPDPGTPIEDTLRALDDLRAAGKVRHIAASNFSADELNAEAAAAQTLGVPGFVGCQDEYSLIARGIEQTLMPAIAANGLGLVPYFPLGGGALTGKYRKNAPLPAGTRHAGGSNRFLDPHWDTIEALASFAEARGHTLLDLAMSWLACRPTVVSIIAGATKPEQIAGNVAAVGWKLSDEEMAEVDAITAG